MAKKRNIAVILLLSFVMMFSVFALSACGKKSGDEVGVYYFDSADNQEYTITLDQELGLQFKVAGKDLTGSYSLEGTSLKFKLSDKSEVVATYANDSITIKYNDVDMTFIRKIDYTVTFNTNDGSKIDSVVVVNGRKVAKPADPTKKQHAFMGWCSDADLTQAFDFDQKITGNVTLYAKWSYIDIVNTLTYKNDDIVTTTASEVKVTEGKEYTLEVPKMSGTHSFIGWGTADGTLLTDAQGKSLKVWDPSLGDIEIVALSEINYTYTEQEDGSFMVAGNENTANLSEIVIPAMHAGKPVTAVGIFEKHLNATKVVIPNSVVDINEIAFIESPLVASYEITAVEGVENPVYTAEDGIIYKDNGATLVRYPVAKKGIEYSLNGKKKDEKGYQAGEYFKVPASVTKIDNRAFYEVLAGDNQYNPEYTGSLTKVILPANLTEIGAYAFYFRGKLGTVIFDGEGKLPLTIGDGAFKYVPLGEYVDSITNEDESVTKLPLDQIKGFKIPNNTVKIGSAAFMATMNLWSQIPQFSSQLIIPEGVKSIGDGAFEANYNCKKVVLPASLESIGTNVFTKCYQLKDVTFGKDIKIQEISDGLFQNCPISSIQIPKSVRSIGSFAFGSTQLQSITIPEGVTKIADNAFDGCGRLKEAFIPLSVTDFGFSVFSGCGQLALEKIHFAEGSSIAKVQDGIMYSYDMKSILLYPSSKKDTEYVMPDTIEVIPGTIFKNNRSLTKVTLSKNLKAISGEAFSGASNLTSITIPASVERIDKEAFRSCRKLAEVKFEAGSKLTYIGDAAFYGCSFTTIDLPKGLDSIGTCAFQGTGLTEITFPDSVTSIAEKVLWECGKLTKVVLPKNLKSMGNNVFDRDYKLSSITIDTANKNFDTIDGVLYNEGATELLQYPLGRQDIEFTIPDSVTTIKENAFSGVNILQKVNLSKNITKIGANAFSSCVSLKSIDLSNITEIGESAFAACKALEEINLSRVTELPAKAFNGCESLTKVDLSNITKLGENCFQSCSKLSEIIFGDKLTEIPYYGFAGCGLTELVIPSTIKVLGFCAFSSNKLTKVTFEEGVEEVGNWAFSSNKELTTVTFADSIYKMGDYIFDRAFKLETVNLPKNLKEFGVKNFTFCYSLKNINISEENKYFKSINGHLYTKDGKKLVSYAFGDPATKFVIDGDVTTIGRLAFYNEHPNGQKLNVREIVFGENVTTFEENALGGFYIGWRPKERGLDIITVDSQALVDNFMFGYGNMEEATFQLKIKDTLSLAKVIDEESGKTIEMKLLESFDKVEGSQEGYIVFNRKK